MDTDITPIFEDDEDDKQSVKDCPPLRLALQPEETPSVPNEDCTRLQDILDPPDPPQSEYSSYPPQYHPQQFPMYAPPQQMMPPYAPAEREREPIKWDPFSTIGTTAWVVMAVVFIIGFIIGKLR